MADYGKEEVGRGRLVGLLIGKMKAKRGESDAEKDPPEPDADDAAEGDGGNMDEKKQAAADKLSSLLGVDAGELKDALSEFVKACMGAGY